MLYLTESFSFEASIIFNRMSCEFKWISLSIIFDKLSTFYFISL